MKYLKIFVLALFAILVFFILWGITSQFIKILFCSIGLTAEPILCFILGLIFSAFALLIVGMFIE